MRGCTSTCFNWIPLCAKQAAWASRVQVCMENYILQKPLNTQLVQIIGRKKFSLRFESWCWILSVLNASPKLFRTAKFEPETFPKHKM